jgi:hypothetical protein
MKRQNLSLSQNSNQEGASLHEELTQRRRTGMPEHADL